MFVSEWPGQRRAVKDGKLLIPGDTVGIREAGCLLRSGGERRRVFANL